MKKWYSLVSDHNMAHNKITKFSGSPFCFSLERYSRCIGCLCSYQKPQNVTKFCIYSIYSGYLSFNYYSKYNLFHHYMILSLQIFCVKKYHKLYLACRQCGAICLYPRVSNSVLISTSSELYIFDCLQLNFSTSGAPTIELGSKLKQLN